jgi:tetratricopeptide (TPR) repeat protein
MRPFALLLLLFSTPALATPEAAEHLAEQGQAAFDAGEYQKAADLLTKAIAEDPTDPELLANRGSCYDLLGKTAEALHDFDESLKKKAERSKDPKDRGLAPYVYNRGLVLVRAGRLAEAAADFEKTLALDPTAPEVRDALAWIYATAPDAAVRDPQKALTLAEAELKQNGLHSPTVADTLAAADAANGRFPEAVLQEQAALDMARHAGQRREYALRLRLYQAGKAYIAPAAKAGGEQEQD